MTELLLRAIELLERMSSRATAARDGQEAADIEAVIEDLKSELSQVSHG